MVFERLFGNDESTEPETEPADAAQADGEAAISELESMETDSTSGPDASLHSRLGESYDVSVTDTASVGGKPIITDTATEGVVAGSYVRDMFEAGAETAQAPLWIGYDEDAHRGFREAPLRFESLFRHLWITGTTGYGKTTALLNMMVQWAYAGYGFVYVDPKARDSRELLRMLPEHRLEDVVWIEPGSVEHDRTVGLNFLELPDCDTTTERENEIENRIENLKAIFDTDEYWGVNMESITESMARAMMQSDRPFSVIDMYFTLLNAERREEFALDVDDPYVREFCLEIAQMDDETVRPLLKRIKSWVENAVIRRIIAHRESTIDFRDIVANDRIVIVSTPVENTDIKKMVTLGVMRNLWSAIQHRSYGQDAEPDPYFVLCDEFDDIASENLDIESMLARARSMRLSVTLASQYPSQFDEDTLKSMQNNCDTLLSFSVNDVDDARLLMKRFQGYTAEDLISTDQYQAWTKLPLGGGQYSDPVLIRSFPPYPPLRSADAVDDIIEQSLARYGTDPLTDAEILQNLLYSDSNDAANPEKVLAETMAEAIRAVQLREGVREENGWVETTAVDDELLQRLDRDDEAHLDIEVDPVDLLDVRDTSRLIEVDLDVEADIVVARLSEDGEDVIRPETGTVRAAGGAEHDALLTDTERALTERGFSVSILEQDGSAQPDATATHSAFETTFTIEAETTTPDRPVKVLRNLARAREAGRTPIFAVRPGDTTAQTAARVENICSPPIREMADGTERFYTCDERLTFGGGATTRGGVTAVRPRKGDSNRTVWMRDDDEYVLSDGETEFACIPADSQLSKDALPATYSYDRETGKYTVYEPGETHYYDSKAEFQNAWVPVKRSFIPNDELPDGTVDRDAFVVVVVPADGQPVVYQSGRTYALSDCLDDGSLWPASETGGDVPDVDSAAGDGCLGAETPPPVAADPSVDLDADNNAVEAFAAMYVREAPDAMVSEDRLFESYSHWLAQHDLDGTTDKGWFTRKLGKVVDFETERARQDGDRVQFYTGITLTPDSKMLLDSDNQPDS
ncbi:TraM recognition domain-containing protein [Halopenitus persicus]|uniref:TraM recognition domain-containing protein n=1 Tax=Halopenitus persicus TaxID=1048396 RepID=UPI00156176B3|nr:TraM recognition domain-containing protein [Halopenitus persicus]